METIVKKAKQKPSNFVQKNNFICLYEPLHEVKGLVIEIVYENNYYIYDCYSKNYIDNRIPHFSLIGKDKCLDKVKIITLKWLEDTKDKVLDLILSKPSLRFNQTILKAIDNKIDESFKKNNLKNVEILNKIKKMVIDSSDPYEGFNTKLFIIMLEKINSNKELYNWSREIINKNIKKYKLKSS